MEIITGVYRILNLVTGDCYIGSSVNVKYRWTKHKCPSSWTSRPSKLYEDMQTYGIDKFEFSIIEETTEEKLKHREQYYIETLKPSYNRYNAEGLNIDRRNELQREWKAANRERVKKYQCKWMEANREIARERARECCRAYYSRICLYNGEEIRFATLRARFQRAGIPNPTEEARKYIK